VPRHAGLTLVTYDVEEAHEWLEVSPEAMGVEGVVAKPGSTDR
jgi:hypothetical protein